MWQSLLNRCCWPNFRVADDARLSRSQQCGYRFVPLFRRQKVGFRAACDRREGQRLHLPSSMSGTPSDWHLRARQNRPRNVRASFSLEIAALLPRLNSAWLHQRRTEIKTENRELVEQETDM